MRKAVLLSLAVLPTALVGCANIADLDKAQLNDIALASEKDIARREKALERRYRESFGGASFSDGRGTIITTFTADQYDEFRAYMKTNPDRGFPPRVKNWPLARLSFQTSEDLFGSDPSVRAQPIFYLCDAKVNRLSSLAGFNGGGFGGLDPLWRDSFVVTKSAAREVTAARAEVKIQTYEVFFNYVFWEKQGHTSLKDGDVITLLPIPGDLCVSMYKGSKILPPSIGAPLRIDKDRVNRALGPLPRPLPLLWEKFD